MRLSRFGGRFFKAADVDKPMDLTIVSCDEEVFDDGERKAVLAFAESPKRLVLNQTRINALIQIFGTDDSDALIQQRIRLFRDSSISFRGNQGGIGIQSCAEPPPVVDDGDNPF